jgi:predicted lipoprotein with Yx(FWY)xxD motif
LRLDIIAWEAQLTSPVRIYRHRALAWPVAALAGASILLAACGSSSKAATAPPTTGASAQAVSGTSASNASVTLSTADIPGVGTVLVNGDGRTLYILASEKGGTVNCTATGGCTKVWPAAVLPTGMSKGIAGTGVQASLLGSVMSPAGDERLTYGGWPLYTFIGDKKAGDATGQNLTDSYGLWEALSPSGNPVTTPAPTAPTTPAAPSTAASTPATPTTAAPPTTVPSSGGGVSY